MKQMSAKAAAARTYPALSGPSASGFSSTPKGDGGRGALLDTLGEKTLSEPFICLNPIGGARRGQHQKNSYTTTCESYDLHRSSDRNGLYSCGSHPGTNMVDWTTVEDEGVLISLCSLIKISDEDH